MSARGEALGRARGWAAPAGGAEASSATSFRLPAPWIEGLVLALSLVLFTVALAPRLRETGVPPGWDQAVHLRDSLVYERLLRHPLALTPEVFKAILHGSEDFPLLTPSGYYPPLVPGVTALLYLAAGRSYATAMATGILFLGLLMAGTWRLGDRLMGRPAGFLAALLLLAAPGIRINASEYMLDLPLAALVILSAGSLLATGGFSRRGRSVLFGLLCGAGMLVKWSFFLFLAVPSALVLGRGLMESRRDGRPGGGRWLNLGLAALACALVMAPYYAPIFPILVRKTLVHAGGAADGFASPFTAASALYHLNALPRKLLGWPLTGLVAAGAACLAGFSLKRREEVGAPAIFLGSWALSLYLLFSFAVANKQSRYLLPWLPVLFLLAAGGVVEIWRGGGARVRIASAVLLPVLALAGLSGGWRPEASGNWRIPALVDRLAADLPRDLPEGKGAWRLAVLPDMREVNGPTVGYFVARRGLQVTTVQMVNRMKRHVKVPVGLDPFNRGDFYQTFDDYDYLITKTGKNAVPPWESVVPEMQRYFQERREEFSEIGLFREPDGSVVALYRRNRA